MFVKVIQEANKLSGINQSSSKLENLENILGIHEWKNG